MARISNVTFGQVAQIADAMTAAGARPTARAVRERIGFGSMGTVHRLLQQWAGKGGAGAGIEGEGSELPEHVAKVLVDYIGAEVATACGPLQEELAEAKEAAMAIASENERLAGIIESQTEVLANERTAAAAIEGRALRLAEEVASLNEQVIDERHAAENARRELATAMMRLEGLAAKDAEIAALRAELSREQQQRIEAEKQAAVFEALLTKDRGPAPAADEYRLEPSPPDMPAAPAKAKRVRPAAVKA